MSGQRASAWGLSHEPDDWRYRAACRIPDHDPELWFPPTGDTAAARAQTEAAKAVCRTCPVVAACLEFALSTGQDSGVWGGMSEDERSKVMGPRLWTQPTGSHTLERIRAMAGQNYADREIGVAVGMHTASVQKVRRRHGIPAGRRPTSGPAVGTPVVRELPNPARNE